MHFEDFVFLIEIPFWYERKSS